MSQTGPGAAGAGVWTEHKHQDGRVFWYNTVEKRSVWEKPTELKTPRERAMEGTPWKAYKSGEKTYYVHSVTKKSSWTLPEELQELFKGLPEDPPPGASPVPPTGPAAAGVSPTVPGAPMSPATPGVFGAGSPPPGPAAGLPVRPIYTGPPPGFPRGPAPVGVPVAPFAGSPPVGLPPKPVLEGSASPAQGPPAAASAVPVAEAPVFEDEEKAQEAFIGLLKEKGVGVDWTWERTMRTIVTEPLYKALKSLSERKAAFNKYVGELRGKAEAEKSARQEKAKVAWKKLFAQKLKSHNSFATAKKWFGTSKEWKLVKDDEEGRAVFDSIIKEMKDAEVVATREMRHRNMDVLMSLLRNFEMDVLTRWKDAYRTVVESDEYMADAKLQEMEVADMIIVFEEHMRVVEKGEVERRRKAKEEAKRTERKRRAACKEMMQELKEKGVINANSKWSQIYPIIKDDERFTSMIGQPGSSPLDYFYDIVDELDRRLMDLIHQVEKGLKDAGFKVTEETSREEFFAKVEETGGWGKATDGEKDLVYDDILREAARQAKEARRKAERQRRYQAEDLRYAMKGVEPRLADRLDLTFEELKALREVTTLKEWADCGDDDVRRSAWEHFVIRTREKQADRERGSRDKDLRRPRDPLDGDGDRIGSSKRERLDASAAHGDDREGASRRREERRSTRRSGAVDEDEDGAVIGGGSGSNEGRGVRRKRDPFASTNTDHGAGADGLEGEQASVKRRRQTNAAETATAEEDQSGDKEEGEV